MPNIPDGYLKRKTSTIPFGYELSEIEGYIKPIPHELEILKKYIASVQNKEYSLEYWYFIFGSGCFLIILDRPAWVIFLPDSSLINSAAFRKEYS